MAPPPQRKVRSCPSLRKSTANHRTLGRNSGRYACSAPTAARPRCRAAVLCRAASGFQRGVQGDVDSGQRLAHRAAFLGRLRGTGESGRIQAVDLAADGELDAGEPETAGRVGAERSRRRAPQGTAACRLPRRSARRAPSRNRPNGRRRSVPRGWYSRPPPRRPAGGMTPRRYRASSCSARPGQILPAACHSRRCGRCEWAWVAPHESGVDRRHRTGLTGATLKLVRALRPSFGASASPRPSALPSASGPSLGLR